MSVLIDLATRLQAAGVGTRWNGTTGTIVLGRRIDKPGDTILALQTYPGDPSRLRDADYQAADERYNVQVTARAVAQKDAEDLANTAWTAVQGRHLTINQNRYAHIRAPQKPAYIGVDEGDRPLVVFNLEIRRHGL